MEKKTIEKLDKVQRILNNVGDKVLEITSGNYTHNGVTQRSTLQNVSTYLIPYIIENAEDEKLKTLVKKTKRNLETIDLTIMSQLSPSTITERNLRMLSNWLKHLSEELKDYIG